MTYPAGTVTRRVVIPPAVSLETGETVPTHATITASRSDLVRGEERLLSEPEQVVVNDTTVALELPVTDQAGYSDGVGGVIVLEAGQHTHTYTAQLGKVVGTSVLEPVQIGPFVLPLGDGTDVDLMSLLTARVAAADLGSSVAVPDALTPIVERLTAVATAAQDLATSLATSKLNVADLLPAVAAAVAAPSDPLGLAGLLGIGNVVDLGDKAGVLDLSAHTLGTQSFTLRATGALSLAPSGMPTVQDGKAGTFSLRIAQDATSGRVLTLDPAIKASYSIKPILPSTATGVDLLHFMWTGLEWVVLPAAYSIS